MNDWIEGFLEYTKHTGSPEIYRKWAAVSIISAGLERKVWSVTRGKPRYPNLYVVLVGPPGVGKTLMSAIASEFIRSLKGHHVSYSSVTKASLIDTLNAARRDLVRPNENPSVVSFNSLYVASNELGVLLPAYDNEFMATLTDLWDCLPYSEKRRTKDLLVQIERPQLNLFAACTPSYLMSTLPEGAWDQGFTSRTIFVFSAESQYVGLFDTPENNEDLGDSLKENLRAISGLYGPVDWTVEAKEVISNWAISGCQPEPDHPRLFAYLSRRLDHTVRIATAIMVSETKNLLMKKDHVLRAIDMLVEAEAFMPDIFKMSGGSHARVIDDTYHYVARLFVKENKRPVAASRVYAFVGQRVPAHNVERVVQVMERANLLKKIIEKYGEAYIPLGKNDV